MRWNGVNSSIGECVIMPQYTPYRQIVYDIITHDGPISIPDIADRLNITYNEVYYIIHAQQKTYPLYIVDDTVCSVKYSISDDY